MFRHLRSFAAPIGAVLPALPAALCVAPALALFGALALAAPAVHAQMPAAEFAARRAALFDAADDGVILALGAGEPVRRFPALRAVAPLPLPHGLPEPERRTGDGEARARSVRRCSSCARRTPRRRSGPGARLGVQGVQPRMGIEGRDASTLLARARFAAQCIADAPRARRDGHGGSRPFARRPVRGPAPQAASGAHGEGPAARRGPAAGTEERRRARPPADRGGDQRAGPPRGDARRAARDGGVRAAGARRVHLAARGG